MSLRERDRWPCVIRLPLVCYVLGLPEWRKYITDDPEKMDPRVLWCRENLKSNQWKYDGWNPVIFSFKNRADAVMFALRWVK